MVGVASGESKLVLDVNVFRDPGAVDILLRVQPCSYRVSRSADRKSLTFAFSPIIQI